MIQENPEQTPTIDDVKEAAGVRDSCIDCNVFSLDLRTEAIPRR